MGIITFEAGETTKTFNVDVLTDSVTDSNEIFTAALTNPMNGLVLGGQSTATVTILDRKNLTFLRVCIYRIEYLHQYILFVLCRGYI